MSSPVDAPRSGGSHGPAIKSKPVFLSWSGRDSGRTALAFAALLKDVFSEDVAWHSKRNLTGIQTWREELRTGVDSAKVVVVSLGLRSLASKWLMYEAGAFFPKGRTFLLGCGVGRRAPERTPLRELQVFDACSRPSVRQMVASIADVLGNTPADFEERFDAAWPAFSRNVWPKFTVRSFPDVSLPVVFAPSGFETNSNYDRAVVFERGSQSTYIDRLHTCVALPGEAGSASAAVTVKYVGTLSDDKLCGKIQDLGPHFGDNAPLVDELSKFPATFAIGEPDALHPMVTEWVESCRPHVEARHASGMSAASTPTP